MRKEVRLAACSADALAIFRITFSPEVANADSGRVAQTVFGWMDRKSIYFLKRSSNAWRASRGEKRARRKALVPRGSRRSGVLFNRGPEIRRAAIVRWSCGECVPESLHAFNRAAVSNKRIACRSAASNAHSRICFRIESRLQNGAAIYIAARDRADHARCPRSDLFLTGMAFGGRFSFSEAYRRSCSHAAYTSLQGTSGENYIIR